MPLAPLVCYQQLPSISTKYRDSPVSAVSISAVTDLAQFSSQNLATFKRISTFFQFFSFFSDAQKFKKL
jgi:hypothetical protein